MTPWTVAHQAPLSMGFFRREYWSGLPGEHPNPGIKPVPLMSPALADGFFTSSATCEVPSKIGDRNPKPPETHSRWQYLLSWEYKYAASSVWITLYLQRAHRASLFLKVLLLENESVSFPWKQIWSSLHSRHYQDLSRGLNPDRWNHWPWSNSNTQLHSVFLSS